MASESEHSFELSSEKEPIEGDGSVSESNDADSEVTQEPKIDENRGETTFSYERLKFKSSDPVSGIDYKQREVVQTKFLLLPYIALPTRDLEVILVLFNFSNI